MILKLNKPKDLLPHITWCATGALTFLPLHAAGIYGSADLKQNVKISDYVVSSYTPTLTAMINSTNSLPKRDPTQKPKILIVSQPQTPGMPSLPGALKEAQEIENCLSQECTITHLSHDKATVDTVMEQMGNYEIVHFACHGIQDLEDPLYSSFSLYDGELTLRLLMTSSFDNAELAILSACQTATGDERLPEEAVHLAAVMLAVGYPSVIATMWSIEDAEAPRVVAEVYAKLLGKQDGEGRHKGRLNPAHALHEAVNCLRERAGEMNFAKWVPFVHFGV